SIEYDFDYLEALNIVFEPNTYKIGNLTGNIQWTEINKNKGNKLNFSFVHITDLHIGIGDSDYGTSGYNDTMPIGDVGSNEKYLRAIVNWTNSNKDIYNLSFVIVTGDITDSAEKSEFLKAKEILDTLEIPYIPLLGNHDVWPMTKDTEAEASIGDFYFNEVFSPVFYNLSNKFQKWDNGTKNKALFNGEAKNLNGSTGHNSYFQNFAFEYNGYYFICLDFVSRDFTNSSFGKGVLPQAKLYDSDKVRGTFSWLKEKLKNNTDKGKDSILLFSHHPASKDAAHHSLSELGINNIFTRVITSALFTFSPIEYAILTYELNKYKEDIGGWFAGHFHKSSSYNIKPTIPISTICPGIVTASTFDGGNAHIRIVDVYGK
ncbi:MAG: metallophosphoesterase, partial [Candidatus Thermoplasmatota archaeon]